jgi:hypothetical protein
MVSAMQIDVVQRSRQVRAIDPDALDTPHPRAVEMAEAMREGANTFRLITGRGFSAAEIIEYGQEAQRLAREAFVQQITPRADLMSDMAIKARDAIPNRMPLPKGTVDNQSLALAWGIYCMARSAYKLDAWPGQRERCLSLLTAYFRKTTAGPAVTRHIIDAVAAHLVSKVRQ